MARPGPCYLLQGHVVTKVLLNDMSNIRAVVHTGHIAR